MKIIKNGDIVVRISYNRDIIFIVKNCKNKSKILLSGVFERILADSDILDLELVSRERLKLEEKNKENKILTKENRYNSGDCLGKVLHLDGDKRYSEKSFKYYNKMGIDAIVKNIPENKQSKIAYDLLKYYKPDIIVITGHDGMIKKGYGYYDLYNYRNSKYFIRTVKEARRYSNDNNIDLVIFAGACQSYFEALISAGANFASSPARILIDIMDPLIVARKVAITDKNKYLRVEDVESELRDGNRGIGGIGAHGKKGKICLL